jgi:hypothetical protein
MQLFHRFLHQEWCTATENRRATGADFQVGKTNSVEEFLIVVRIWKLRLAENPDRFAVNDGQEEPLVMACRHG